VIRHCFVGLLEIMTMEGLSGSEDGRKRQGERRRGPAFSKCSSDRARPDNILTPAAFDKPSGVYMALGGSTNAIIA
jgi:dihydroxyacid dehydratase/phosphogluconate dehydratase